MRFYSDELKQFFDTEEALLSAEETAKQKKEAAKETKAKLAKAVEKELSENETLLGITDIKVKKEQRAMSENDFIKNSYVIREVYENA